MQRTENQPGSGAQSTNWMALAGAAGLGAVLTYYFDPVRGVRRRARVRDRVVGATNTAGEALDTTARDLGNRARGLTAVTRSRFGRGETNDQVLAARVRSKLGRIVSHPQAIVVTAEQGRVVLSGPVLAREADDVIARVRKVRGVRDVENRLDVYDTAEGVPALQGGASPRGGRFELRQENWSPAARFLTSAAGGSLALYAARRRDAVGAALGLAGLTLLARGASNKPLRQLAGAGRRAVDIQKTINIDAPLEQVFGFFTDWENWPRFMTHVREVRDTGEGRQHWVVDGPAGAPVEWDAEVTLLVPNELVSWQSVEGAAVEHVGTLRFTPNEDGSTRVQVQMSYSPPAGMAGHAVAVLFQRDPKRQMDDDLGRLKTTIETGTPPRDAAQRDTTPRDAGQASQTSPAGQTGQPGQSPEMPAR